MSSFLQQFETPFGASPLPSKGYTPEQLAERDQVLNMPLEPAMLSDAPIPYRMSPDGTRQELDLGLETTSLGEYQSNRGRSIGTVAVNDNTLGSFMTWGTRKNLFPTSSEPIDPDFDPNDHLALYDIVNPEYWEFMNEATSKEDLIRRTQYYGKLSKDSDYFDTLGLEGVGYRIAFLMGDIPLTQILKLGKAVKITRNISEALDSTYRGRALVAGTTEGALEGIKMSLNPHTRDEADVLLAIGLGGAVGGLFKAGTYTPDVQKAFIGPIQELGNEIAANGGKLIVPPKTASRLEKLQFNVASVLRRSKSPTLARFSDETFLDVTQEAPATIKAAEVQTSVIDGIQQQFNKLYTPLYKEYLKEVSRFGSFGGRYRITSQDDFYELVGKVQNQPNHSWEGVVSDDLLTKIRKANDDMGTQAFDVLERNGNPRFLDGTIKRGKYMPRKWDRARLAHDIESGKFAKGKEDVFAMFSQGIRSAVKQLGYDISDEKALDAGKKFVDTLTKQQVGSRGPLDAAMRGDTFKAATEELQKVLSLTDDEVELLEAALKGKQGRKSKEGISGYTKRRGDIDVETKYIDSNGNEHTLSDYLDNNVQSLWMSYSRQMGGDTALRKLGIEDTTQIPKLRAQIEEELRLSSGRLSSAGKRDLANFDAVMADFLNISQKKDPEGSYWKATRSVNNLVRASKLGATWFAMAAELGQVTATAGLRSVVGSIPELTGLNSIIRKGGPKAKEVIDEIQSFHAIGDQLSQMPSASRMDDMLTDGSSGGAWDKIEAVSDRLAESAYILGGTKSGTAGLEIMFASAINNRVAKMVNKAKLSRDDKLLLKQMGFTEELTQKNLLDNVRANADGKNMYMLNLAKWGDAETAQKFSYGMRRLAGNVIQRGNVGDQVGAGAGVSDKLLKDTFMGSMSLNLRNYMLTAWNKQFGRMAGQVMRGGDERWQAFRNIAYQSVAVTTAVYAKEGLNLATGAIDEEKFEERTDPLALASRVASMTTFGSIAAPTVDAAYSTITGETMGGHAVRGGNLSINPLGAAGQYAGQAAGVASTVAKAFDPNRDVTAYEVRKALGLLPLATFTGVNQLYDNIAQEVAGD